MKLKPILMLFVAFCFSTSMSFALQWHGQGDADYPSINITPESIPDPDPIPDPITNSTLSYGISYNAGYSAGVSDKQAGKTSDDTVPVISDAAYDSAGYKTGYADGYAGNLNKYDETTSLSVQAYNKGYAVGKDAGSQNKTFDDTVPSNITAIDTANSNTDCATNYKTGYKEGWTYGYYSVYLTSKQQKASDVEAYNDGYLAAWQNKGYSNVPPANRTTDDAKKKYTDSYHMGYFEALNEKILLQTGKYTTTTNPNGDQALCLENGTQVIKWKNGATTVKNGNICVTSNPDGTQVTGWCVSDDGKGNYVWNYSDGSTYSQYIDGSWYYVKGTYWKLYNASAGTSICSDGSWEYWNFKTGYYCFTDAKGVSTWYKNGVVTTPPASS